MESNLPIVLREQVPQGTQIWANDPGLRGNPINLWQHQVNTFKGDELAMVERCTVDLYEMHTAGRTAKVLVAKLRSTDGIPVLYQYDCHAYALNTFRLGYSILAQSLPRIYRDPFVAQAIVQNENGSRSIFKQNLTAAGLQLGDRLVFWKPNGDQLVGWHSAILKTIAFGEQGWVDPYNTTFYSKNGSNKPTEMTLNQLYVAYGAGYYSQDDPAGFYRLVDEFAAFQTPESL